ncbi:hypothetical protein [Rhizobium sp. FKY42]|uniref:hypothetical protein n=1 Tax=Rhizobium sp. FKY42 TaxID=2562310 RepID=UPI0010C05378|nr:hypothetical protein [Rhizobium sp. FKY42]
MRATIALEEIDLSLFGFEEAGSALPQAVRAQADAVLLELKSADAAAGAQEQRALLAEMMQELREQFAAFRDLRVKTAQLCETGDEAAQKLARADLKAATDAVKLIVATIEKVDSLQRQLMRDLELEEERQANENGYQEAVHEVQKLIEDRARELFDDWKRREGAGNGGGGAARADPPALDEGCGGNDADIRAGHEPDSG